MLQINDTHRNNTPRYMKDFQLLKWSHYNEISEYLKMVMQYGFITIFVCAFPLGTQRNMIQVNRVIFFSYLKSQVWSAVKVVQSHSDNYFVILFSNSAPFFALLVNILDIRLDAKKILTQYRRPIAKRVQCIGVWLGIMKNLGYLSIITNALIMGITSEFIPKLVYRSFYSPNGSLTGWPRNCHYPNYVNLDQKGVPRIQQINFIRGGLLESLSEVATCACRMAFKSPKNCQ